MAFGRFDGTLEEQFDQFMASSLRSVDLQSRGCRFYVRKGSIHAYKLKGKPEQKYNAGMIDLASLHVPEELRGGRIFTHFLQHVETYMQPIYVEIVTEPRLISFLLKQGFELIEGFGSPSLVKVPNENQSS